MEDWQDLTPTKSGSTVGVTTGGGVLGEGVALASAPLARKMGRKTRKNITVVVILEIFLY
jgi:hypothetical protein